MHPSSKVLPPPPPSHQLFSTSLTSLPSTTSSAAPSGGGGSSNNCNVRVGVRVRPLTPLEQSSLSASVVSVHQSERSISIGTRSFKYDMVFDWRVTQKDMYSGVGAKGMLEGVFDGYNATILAYGQTGSGKTFTMGSESSQHQSDESDVSSAMTATGLIPRFMTDLFKTLSSVSDPDGPAPSCKYTVTASFLEVYGEDIHDLLADDSASFAAGRYGGRPSLPLREDAGSGCPNVIGLSVVPVTSARETLDVLKRGTRNRTTASTLMNTSSSRSHAVFTVCLTKSLLSVASAGQHGAAYEDERDAGGAQVAAGATHLLAVPTSTSKFTFVDLAGSERMKKTGAEGALMKEGIQINVGLLALGNVINALADDSRQTAAALSHHPGQARNVHVPYRQSKLTRLLQDALGGNSRTLFLACVSPSATNVSESLSTLQYANRARNIKNTPVKNFDPTSMELRRLQALTRALRIELVKEHFSVSSPSSLSLSDALFQREDVKRYLLDFDERVSRELGKGRKSDADNCADGSCHQPPSRLLAGAQGWNDAAPRVVISGDGEDGGAFDGDDMLQDNMFEGVSPDEDMAILDQLLELQQQETEYQKNQSETSQQLKKVDSELVEQEKLLTKLRESLKVYHSMKAKYEELVQQISSLESEKSMLAEQLKKVEADPTRGCSKAIKQKLAAIEESLATARRDSQKQQQLCKKAESEALRCKNMEKKIEELKANQIQLMKKQKETFQRHKEMSDLKTREIEALKRREKKTTKNVSKLESDCKKHVKALERRTSYCQKVTQKLKQTETHLMRLLAMRKRELDKSSAGNRRASETGTLLFSAHHATAAGGNHHRSRVSFIQPPMTVSGEEGGLFAPRNEEVGSVKFLLESYIGGRIEMAEVREKYEASIAEYSDLMRSLVAEVNALNSMKEGRGEVEDDETISEHERVIDELELRIEIVGGEMEELRSRLGNSLEEDMDGEGGSSYPDSEHAATLKVVGDMAPPVARTIVLELMETLTRSELERKALEKEMKRTTAGLSSLEEENAVLKSKISTLTSFKRLKTKEEGEGIDGPGNSFMFEEDGGDVYSQLNEKERRLSETKEKLDKMEKHCETQEMELAECKEKLVVVDASKEVTKETATVLAQLQTYWKLIGVDLSEREKARHDLETCVEKQCNALLEQVTKMERETRVDISKLKQANEDMEKRLGMKRQECFTDGAHRLSLLKQKQHEQDTFQILEPIFTKAKIRKARVHEEVVMLLKALDQGEDSLTSKTRSFLSLGYDSPGIFAEDLLSHCEDEVRKLRVTKSELLVQSHSLYLEAHTLVTETHSSIEDIVSLCRVVGSKREAAVWWTEDVCRAVSDFVSRSNMKVTTSSLWSKHLALIVDALTPLASRRRVFADVLKSVVEDAHKTLMGVVEGEDDATEAYASFHEALFRLPRLSQEHIKACVDELGILVGAAEIMMQSEAEALTVVWDALDIRSKGRGTFWAECEDAVKRVEERKAKGVFERILIGEEGMLEPWMAKLLGDAKALFKTLELKLCRLTTIHKEVEKKRAKQDAKGRIMSLDSEIRIIDAKLTQFEEKAGNKQRLVSKKASSGLLLKEEKFRKHMQSKFVGKLSSLGTMLKEWEARERVGFDLSILSEEVRNLLSSEGGAEERTAFMHLRTTKSSTGVVRGRTSAAVGAAEGGGDDGGAGEGPEERVAVVSKGTVTKSSVAAAVAAATAMTEALGGGGKDPFANVSATQEKGLAKAAQKKGEKAAPLREGGVAIAKKKPSTESQPFGSFMKENAAAPPSNAEYDDGEGYNGALSPVRNNNKLKKGKASSTLMPFGNLLSDTPTKM